MELLAVGWGRSRSSPPRLWELSESSSRSFYVGVIFFFWSIATIHFTLPPPFLSPVPRPSVFFWQESRRAVESVRCGGGEQDFGFMVGYFLHLT